jgi:tetratricopeptide (TPR) repeat protein
MKKLILNFDLRDNCQFWIYFSSLANELKLCSVRTTLYKLSKNKLLSDNYYLNSILANCYLKTGNYNLSLKYLKKLEKKYTNNNAKFYFVKAMCYIFNSLSRKNKNKLDTFLKGINLLNNYSILMNRENAIEVLFNNGRFNQFIGNDELAIEYYDKFLNKIYLTQMEILKKEEIQMGLFYNYSLIIKKSGNEKEAHRILIDNIII